MKKIIRLTESDLHKLVKESVENILINEIGYGNPEEFLAPDALAAYKKRKENSNSVEDDIRVASLKAVKAARNAAFDAAGAVANDTDAQKLKAAKAAFNAAIDAAIAATKSSAMMNNPNNI